MLAKINSTVNWLPYYLLRELRRIVQWERARPRHVYFCICDHFEPYWNKADRRTARRRIQRWTEQYPRVADSFRDSEGNRLKYSFFYPEEEYQEEDLKELAALCHAGYGEVEIHLHHHNDTAENLRTTLMNYKHLLHEKHGLLSTNRATGEICYGFIHGNWALNNSRRDGCWCGVNNETSILLETGCYADFTMPSAPSDTQTRKVNSIYYAVDGGCGPKSHDRGIDAACGKQGEGLLMVQGPLALSWRQRKLGLLPKIENGGLYAKSGRLRERVRLWLGTGISIAGRREHVFIKIYTHGAQEGIADLLFGGGLAEIMGGLKEEVDQLGGRLHHVSAREMTNIIHALEADSIPPGQAREYKFTRASSQ